MSSNTISNAIDEPLKTRIKLDTGKGVCEAYRHALMDILSFWEKSRMSLRRINKGRMGSAAGSESSSNAKDELANIYHQHWLDICAFGQVLKEYEIPQTEAFVELRDLIISKKESQDSGV